MTVLLLSGRGPEFKNRAYLAGSMFDPARVAGGRTGALAGLDLHRLRFRDAAGQPQPLLRKIWGDWTGYVERNGVRHITALDSTFTVPKPRLRQLLPMLQDAPFTWEAYTRANTIYNEDVVTALERARCHKLSIGFESMSPNTLAYMHKQVRAEQNRTPAWASPPRVPSRPAPSTRHDGAATTPSSCCGRPTTRPLSSPAPTGAPRCGWRRRSSAWPCSPSTSPPPPASTA